MSGCLISFEGSKYFQISEEQLHEALVRLEERNCEVSKRSVGQIIAISVHFYRFSKAPLQTTEGITQLFFPCFSGAQSLKLVI